MWQNNKIGKMQCVSVYSFHRNLYPCFLNAHSVLLALDERTNNINYNFEFSAYIATFYKVPWIKYISTSWNQVAVNFMTGYFTARWRRKSPVAVVWKHKSKSDSEQRHWEFNGSYIVMQTLKNLCVKVGASFFACSDPES
jgi:hypothetical protein